MEFYNIWEIAGAFKVAYTRYSQDCVLTWLLKSFLTRPLDRYSETNKERKERLKPHQHFFLRSAVKIKKPSSAKEAKKELIPKLTSSNLFGIKSIPLLL